MKREVRHIRTLLAVGVAVVGLMGVHVPAAQAKSDVTVRTTDLAGRATFFHLGEKLRVCDLKADGKRVAGRLLWADMKGSHHTLTEDKNGAGNTCAWQSFDIPEGTKVTIKVCLKKGARGIQEKCVLKQATA